MIKAIVFDLDDTLISEEDYIRSGYKAVARVLCKTYSEDFHTGDNLGGKSPAEGNFAGSSFPEETACSRELFELYREDSAMVFNRFLDRHGISFTEKKVKELVTVYREHLPQITFFEDVRPVLKILREKGIRTGIISDGYTITQENKVKVLGLENLMDHIILTDRLGRDYWKPDPRPFRMMSEALGVVPEEMLYVGDNPTKDFYPKTKIAIRTARIIRPFAVYANAPYREGVREDYRIHSLYELKNLI